MKPARSERPSTTCGRKSSGRPAISRKKISVFRSRSPLRALPRDPCDPNFAARLNAVSRGDLPTADGVEDDAESEDELAEEDADEEAGDEEFQDSDARHSHATHVADNDALSDGNAPAGVTEVKGRTAGKSPPTTPNGQPLHLRLFFQRHMTDLVRLIGHAEHRLDEFLARVEPLHERYGEEAVKRGLDELVDVTRRDEEQFLMLKPHVRQLALQIIGRPPASTS